MTFLLFLTQVPSFMATQQMRNKHFRSIYSFLSSVQPHEHLQAPEHQPQPQLDTHLQSIFIISKRAFTSKTLYEYLKEIFAES